MRVGFYFAKASIDYSTKGSEVVVMMTLPSFFLVNFLNRSILQSSSGLVQSKLLGAFDLLVLLNDTSDKRQDHKNLTP